MNIRLPEFFLNLSLLILIGPIAKGADDDRLRRATAAGIVEGALDAERAVLFWKGVPFAKPPVESLRWRAPVAPEPWEGVRAAKQHGFKCIQFRQTPSWIRSDEIVGSEDCLYLDVYRPDTSERNLPVYVWIHGGGNTGGDAGRYYIADLAREANAVVVVIQYRLNVFGFFTHPQLRVGATPAEASGNFGLLDQIQALRWIQHNINEFGGNRFNVTIAGESAGGHDVMGLVISPLARGLFHRAVMQSGGMVSQARSTIDSKASDVIDRLLSSNEADSERTSDRGVGDLLREIDARALFEANAGGPLGVPLGNLIEDGHVIPGPLLEVIRSGNYQKVPIILGSNQSECGSVNLLVEPRYPGMPNYPQLVDVLKGKTRLADVLHSANDKELWTKARYFGSQFVQAVMVDEVARQLKRHQDDVFVYRFDWGENQVVEQELQFIYGAAHAIEIPFFHASTDRFQEWANDSMVFEMLNEKNGPGRRMLSQKMVSYLAQFARTGNPNGADTGPVEWIPWSRFRGGPKRIVFDADLEQARISMSREEVSVAGVRFELDQEPEEVRDHVLKVVTTIFPYLAYEYGNYQYGEKD